MVFGQCRSNTIAGFAREAGSLGQPTRIEYSCSRHQKPWPKEPHELDITDIRSSIIRQKSTPPQVKTVTATSRPMRIQRRFNHVKTATIFLLRDNPRQTLRSLGMSLVSDNNGTSLI